MGEYIQALPSFPFSFYTQKALALAREETPAGNKSQRRGCCQVKQRFAQQRLLPAQEPIYSTIPRAIAKSGPYKFALQNLARGMGYTPYTEKDAHRSHAAPLPQEATAPVCV